ncbi:uncharacterized protein EDB91DRAFT_1115127 [Suillus paluster]|uniref:uncharacterized protein n=1 Tax=Suillus paluster TaxID=48578 RepID=UPI001B877DA4|nr:uncharacterized protein EDB91DRAFT_1115127 [Suillus paluster]KAG1747862.1 hypothetical protein EDB91DRAFT_1115127 [Suillus paluster]
MHACLRISEIVKAIFAEVTQVTENGGVQPSWITLYYLALTCRAFREPALDALWAHVPSSEDARSQPVKASLENAAEFSTSSEMAAASRVRLLRPLVDDDWTTFQKYARRVRSLTFETYDPFCPGLHDSAALALLDSHVLPSPLFPLIQELNWYDQRDELFPCLQRCISTTITRLVIHSQCWSSPMADLVAGLGKACPKIKKFRCSMPPASECVMLSDLVTCWGDLEILTTAANARTLQHLTSLKRLRELEILVPEGHHLDLASTSSIIFSLHRFSMITSSIESLLPFLAVLQIFTKSVQLKIEGHTPNTVDLDHLLSPLAEHFKPNVLVSLHIWLPRPIDSPNNYLLVPASVLQMLRAFTGLTELDLGSMNIFLTDDEVLDLVSAWPQMERLYLGTSWDLGVTRVGVTFHGLAGVLERCPNLRSLGVNLDTSTLHDLPVYVDHRYIGITSKKITTLRVGCAECHDVEATGNLLAAMCPNLRQIRRACSVDFWYHAMNWDKVEGFITQRRMGQPQ